MRCRKCGSESNVRNGRRGTAQCFRCRDCGFQFTKEEANGAGRDKRANAILLYVLGLSMNAIAGMHGVCPSTVMRWVRKFALKAYEKPQPGGSVAVELDEMWYFIGSKKKCWVWKAYCRDTGQLVDWKCGDRSSATLAGMLDRLGRLDVAVFFADGWESHAELIEPEMLVRTKAETHAIERNNFRQRHWCGRFRRKTCMVSRSLQMVDLTVSLFVRFHVNGLTGGILRLCNHSF
jgi:IS1 family transposase/transposase-like protein